MSNQTVFVVVADFGRNEHEILGAYWDEAIANDAAACITRYGRPHICPHGECDRRLAYTTGFGGVTVEPVDVEA